MATKAELLARLGANAEYMTTPLLEIEDAENNMKAYLVNVFEVNKAGKANRKNIGFYVIDEGGPNERAYLRDDRRNKVSDFENLADTRIENNFVGSTINGYTIKRAKGVDYDQELNFVEVVAHAENAEGKIEDKRYYIYRDGQNITAMEKVVQSTTV